MTTIKRRRIDGDILEDITELALATRWTSAQIFREISDEEKFKNRAPTKRTIERIVRELRALQEGDTEPWTLKDFEGEDARLILDARRSWILRRKSARPTWSKRDAEWIKRILKVAPDVPGDIVWLVSELYRRSLEKEGHPQTSAIQDFLAFAPWRELESYNNYRTAVENNWIHPVDLWGVLVEMHLPSGAQEVVLAQNARERKKEEEYFER